MEVNLKNERRAFEYHVTARMGNSRRLLEKDPDRAGFYREPTINAMWAGWLAGLERFAKRARRADG